MLIILSGLPGTGKTTIARELARSLGAVHVRIDSIEEAIDRSGIAARPMNDAGYRVAYAVCEDNLRLGLTVIADSVNPLTITRDAWMEVARRAGVPFANVEVVCSDATEHRGRIETRPRVAGSRSLTWEDVLAREYHRWMEPRITIDTAHLSVHDAVVMIRSLLPAR